LITGWFLYTAFHIVIEEHIPRGVGSFEKLGGPGLEGHFSGKKGHLKNLFGDPPPPVAQKISVSVPFWGSKKFSGHKIKKYPGYIIFFPEIKAFFRK
jgi:hypothetical protein